MNNFLWCPKSAIEKLDLHNTLVNVYIICWYLRILPVLHRPDVVDIGVNTI